MKPLRLNFLTSFREERASFTAAGKFPGRTFNAITENRIVARLYAAPTTERFLSNFKSSYVLMRIKKSGQVLGFGLKRLHSNSSSKLAFALRNQAESKARELRRWCKDKR